MAVLPFLAMCFMVLEGYVYTIAAYFYIFHLAFSSILHGVLHHFFMQLIKENEEKSKLLQTNW